MRLNGLDFHIEVEGDPGLPPLVLLHGFTGSAGSWIDLRLALRLKKIARVISVDLIGHGRSAAPVSAERYSLDWSTRDLLALLDSLELPRVDLLGYSLGGRVALHFALAVPERVEKLILESASPGIDDPAARQHRIDADAALADRIERDGVESFVAEWERQPLLALADHVAPSVVSRQRAERLANRPLGLANSLRGMGAGQQTPDWSALAAFHRPVQLIVGQRDARYVEIARRMYQGLPYGHLAVVPEAGHTVHVDQPARVVDIVTGVLTGN